MSVFRGPPPRFLSLALPIALVSVPVQSTESTAIVFHLLYHSPQLPLVTVPQKLSL